jgi:hypothetical protein
MLDFDLRSNSIDKLTKARSAVWLVLLLGSFSACDGEEASNDTDAVEAGAGAGGDSAHLDEGDAGNSPEGDGGSASGGDDSGPSPSPPSTIPRPIQPSVGMPATPSGSGPGQTPPAATSGIPTSLGDAVAGGAGGGNGGEAGANNAVGGESGTGGDNPGPSGGGSSGADPGMSGNGGVGAGGAGDGGVGQAGEGTGGVGEGGDGGTGEPAGGAGGSSSEPGADVFGITELYGSAPSGALWHSAHWSEEGPYSLTERRDENDPSGLSGMRGEGELEVEEGGELVMSGGEPRIYVYPEDGEEWLNVEVTVYYQRVSDQDTAYAGLVIGMRSGPDGHTTDTACDAHTYYSRLRNDGTADFEKELEHSPSSTRESTDLEDFLPPDGEASEGTWVGWKYVGYNIPGEQAVKLEAYIDLSGGENGGEWQLVNETIDDGGWFTDTTCEQYSPENGESDFVWLEGGTVFIRNTNVDEARYRWVSIREIAP